MVILRVVVIENKSRCVQVPVGLYMESSCFCHSVTKNQPGFSFSLHKSMLSWKVKVKHSETIPASFWKQFSSN